MSGQGSPLSSIVPDASRNAITPLATNSSQGIVPVKKKSNALPPESEKPKPDTLIQLNSPKMATPAPPPIINQSDVLKLLKSTSFPS